MADVPSRGDVVHLIDVRDPGNGPRPYEVIEREWQYIHNNPAEIVILVRRVRDYREPVGGK